MENIWVIIAIWILFALLGRKKKRPPVGGSPAAGEAPPAREPAGLMSELERAMGKLRAAEEAARRGAQPPRPPRPRSAQPATWYPKGPARRGGMAAVRGLDDDAEKSSEDEFVVSLEGEDYDEQAEQLVEARRRGADREVRRDVSLEELSAEQATRRAARVDEAIGGRAEHEEWHKRVQAKDVQPKPGQVPGAPAPVRPGGAARAGLLARFATGSVRDAVVLSEILGRPRGVRS